MVSSENVVTASNPKKDKHKMEDPANTKDSGISPFTNGELMNNVPEPIPLSTPLIERNVNITIIKN
ncbi:Uncharacterised protein [Chlamydia trachomatis]|nr:Uncharacterised protein [Chlamydia trachomatis]